MSLKVNVPLLLLAFIGPDLVNADTRIVGGHYCKIQDHPFTVAVLGPTSCGGSLLTLSWVMTAGHCIKKKVRKTYVRVGFTSPSALIQVRRAKRAIAHPKFDVKKLRGFPTELRYDIGLIMVKKSFSLSKVLRPAVLPHPGFTQKCKMATAIGAGTTEPKGDFTPSPSSKQLKRGSAKGYFGRPLKCVDLHITDTKTCLETYPGSTIDDDVVCTREKEYGQDACQGDSGGPLVCTADGTTAVIGIVSAGKGCGMPLASATFTKVEKYLEFINETMRDENNNRGSNTESPRFSWTSVGATVFFSAVLRSLPEMRLV